MSSATIANFIFTLQLFWIGGALAAEKDGVKFPDSEMVDKQTLILNGLGTRTATILKFKVYVGGLFVKNKLSDANSILDSTTPKQMQLRFVRSVGAEKMRDAWDDSFKENCEIECEASMENLATLKGLIEAVKEGDVMTYTVRDEGLEMLLNGKSKGKIPGKQFARTVLSTWIGKHPPNESLRDGLLGKRD